MDHLQGDHLNQDGLQILYTNIGLIILRKRKPSKQLRNDAVDVYSASTSN